MAQCITHCALNIISRFLIKSLLIQYRKFCKICLEHNRYNDNKVREKESDILELVDQFGGMLLDRPERVAFPIEEALILLENRNLKNCNNAYLNEFKEFINIVKEIII